MIGEVELGTRSHPRGVRLREVDSRRRPGSGRIATAVTADGPGIVVDLSRKENLASAGIRTLLELAERIQGRRQQLRLVI